jgi:hypothetical protein
MKIASFVVAAVLSFTPAAFAVSTNPCAVGCTNVPEPSTNLMLGAGLLILAAFVALRQKFAA